MPRPVSSIEVLQGKKVLFFDGVCNLCVGVVQFVLKRNTQGSVVFASLQSELGKALLHELNLPASELNTLYFVVNGTVYSESDGALKLCLELRRLWPMCIVIWLVPGFIRNAVYRYVSKKRYEWFGRRASCLVARPEVSTRFISEAL